MAKKKLSGGSEMYEDLLNNTQAAEIAGVNRMTIYLWRKNGKLTEVHVGGQIFVRREEVERYKKRNTSDD